MYTIAGNGTGANFGSTLPATSAAFGGATSSEDYLIAAHLVVDSAGNTLIADQGNNRIRLVAASTCSSSCAYGLSATTKGYVYDLAGDGTQDIVVTFTSGILATSAKLNYPSGVAVDGSGNILIADQLDNLVLMVSEVATCSSGCAYGLGGTVKGDIYVIAGGNGTGNTLPSNTGEGGAATSARLNHPSAVMVDASGNVIIADSYNNRVRMVAAATCSPACAYGYSALTANFLYTIAGPLSGSAFGTTDNVAAKGTGRLQHPMGLAADSSGNLFVADNNRAVRMVAKATCVSSCAFGRATTANNISTIAGTLGASPGYSGDLGPADAATMQNPEAVAVDGAGNLVIAESDNNVVRMVARQAGTYYGVSATTGDIYAIVGKATYGNGRNTGDGGLASSAGLNFPAGLAVDSAGNLLIVCMLESDHEAIREVLVNAPAVTAVSPASGVTAGGTSVTLTGTGFTSATAVTFGSVAASSYTVNSATSITATSPAESAGTVDITVTTANGTSATHVVDQFTYVAPPTVTAVSPSTGPTGGGSVVTITGTSFIGVSGAAAVKFGANNVTSYTVNTSTQITATSPSGSAGTVDVVVVSTGGTSASGAPDHFTYSGTSGVLTNMNWATSNNQTSATSAKYSWAFTTATTGTITKVTFSVPAATAGTAANVAVYGMGAGTWSGPTAGLITYTVTSPASVSGGIPIYISASGITNTSAAGGFSSQISTYVSGPTLLDQGTANSITFGASNTATPFDLPETMTYTNDTTGFTLMPVPGGGAVSKVVNVTVNTNAATGYTLAIQATPFTNGTITLSQMTTSGAGSLVVDQFAAQASVTGCATLASPYTSSKYVGYNTSSQASVATCGTPTSGADTVALTNWIQIDSSAAAGTYTSTISYIVTPNY
jgi:hypothetical protein